MTKDEKLLKAWDQLVRTLSQKEGLSDDQAVAHMKKLFPQVYELYKEAKKKKKAKE